MIMRTLAASAAVLVLATGGALAQAAAPAAPAMPGSVIDDPACATLNGLAAADQTRFAQDYLDGIKDSNAGAAALRNSNNDAMVGAGANQAGEPGEASGGPDNMAAAPDQGAGGNGQPNANAADVNANVAANANADANGQPAAAGAEDNRNNELDMAANNNAPAGVDSDDAVKAFDGLDAAGLVNGCRDNPDSTFSQIIAPTP